MQEIAGKRLCTVSKECWVQQVNGDFHFRDASERQSFRPTGSNVGCGRGLEREICLLPVENIVECALKAPKTSTLCTAVLICLVSVYNALP